MTEASPARIESLDVLRGFALLGILAVNAPFFSMPWPWAVSTGMAPPEGAADVAAWAIVRVFFEARFYTLFSMLFGASIFLVGGERDDPDAGRRLRRRLYWLAVFGLVHGALIWFGDILLTYAGAGLLVALARSWSAPRLLMVGIVAHVGLGLMAFGQLVAPEAAMAPQFAMFRDAAVAAMGETGGYRGGFMDSLQANFRDWLSLLVFVTMPGMVALAPVMLIGLGLFKAGVLSGRAATGVYLALIGAGAAYLVLQGWLTSQEIAEEFTGSVSLVSDLTISLCAPLATLAYASVLILALRAGAAWPPVLAPVGRMAFTNYLTQSVVMTMVFYGGRGLGLYGEVGHAALWGIVLAVWLAQLVVSPLWLSRFAYGPAEWLWRSLTLGRRVPIRLAAT